MLHNFSFCIYINKEYWPDITKDIINPYNCLLKNANFSIKTQFFEILIFSHDVWGNVHYVRDINIISHRPLIKSFYLPNKTN